LELGKMLLDKVTLLIKTFERPDCLKKLLNSIYKYYKNIPIIVVNDGVPINDIPNVFQINVDFDMGASYCRNLGLSMVNTPYVVTLDDDFIFNERTKLETWLDILENTSIDLISGDVTNTRYEACFKLENKILQFVRKNKGIESGYPLYDIVLQFWMARTEKIRSFGGWCNEFKTIDHMPFFINAFNKIKIAYCNSVYVDHKQERTKEYNRFRQDRSQMYFDLILDKFNLNKIIGYWGNVVSEKRK